MDTDGIGGSVTFGMPGIGGSVTLGTTAAGSGGSAVAGTAGIAGTPGTVGIGGKVTAGTTGIGGTVTVGTAGICGTVGIAGTVGFGAAAGAVAVASSSASRRAAWQVVPLPRTSTSATTRAIAGKVGVEEAIGGLSVGSYFDCVVNVGRDARRWSPIYSSGSDNGRRSSAIS
jgi:hypothetical protein